jgi:phosphoribosylglycinamide formyltransferase-1
MIKKMLNIAVLGSTKGTDMEGIIDAIQKGELSAVLSLVISDRKGAYILERAKNNGIPALFVNPKNFGTREDFDREIVKKLREKKVDLVLLIGYMRILSSYFVSQFRNRVMNIHPSLLPAFAGGMDLDVHKLVIDQGIKVTGCTLHFVDEGTDTGPIIMQKTVEVKGNDTPQTLKQKIQEAEQEAIIEAIKLFQENRIKVEHGEVKLL